MCARAASHVYVCVTVCVLVGLLYRTLTNHMAVVAPAGVCFGVVLVSLLEDGRRTPNDHATVTF